MTDFERGLEMFAAMGLGASHTMLFATIPGAPWSKARPRGTRIDPDVQDAQERTASYLRMVAKEPFTGNVALGCVFFRPSRQRIDADNMLKHVCDAATGVLWADDSHCTAIMGVIELDPERPRTLVMAALHQSSLTRGTDATYPCAVCQKPVSILGQSRGPGRVRKTCSRACSSRLRGHIPLHEPVPCAYCKQPFRRVSFYRTMCSPECAHASFRGKRRAKRQPFSSCTTCGKMLTHLRGGRCRACWQAAPKENGRKPLTRAEDPS